MRATLIFSAASVFLFALFVGAPQARAEIALEFECMIADPINLEAIPSAEVLALRSESTKFDCNMLKQRVLRERSLPFVNESANSDRIAYSLKVSVTRRKVLNGSEYDIYIGEKGKPGMQLPPVFISDGTESTAALIKINKKIQTAIALWAEAKDEAVVKDGKATIEYSDPHGAPVAKKSEGRWILKPSANGYLQKFSGTPTVYNGSAGASFDYSGDRIRVMSGADAYLNRQSVTVISKDNKPELFGVNTHQANGYSAVVVGLDRGNHVNLGVGVGARTAPSVNLKKSLSAGIGVEYNLRPFRKQDSLAFAAGCTLGPNYMDFDVPNYLEKDQLLAISQSCTIAGQILLDKKRGSSLSGEVGENWILNHRDVAGVSANVSLDLKITDRWAISPSVSVSRQTKSLNTASPNYAPDYEGLAGQDLANAQVDASSKAASASDASIYGNVSVSYTFGEGVNRTAQDQRGKALK